MLKNNIQLIKEKILIADIIGKKVQLKKRGEIFWGLCPFHKEKTPSFSVNNRKKTFYCFGCKKYGDVFDFLEEIDGLSLQDSINELASFAGINIVKVDFKDEEFFKKEILKKVGEFFITNFFKNAKLVEYLSKKITINSIKKFKIGYSSAKGGKDFLYNSGYSNALIRKAGLISVNGFPYLKNRIVFPIYNINHVLIAFGGRRLSQKNSNIKYINTSETSLFIKSSSLYGINLLSKKVPFVIIVEGYMDVIAMHENNFFNTVGVLGTAITNEHLELIGNNFTKNIIICLDGDEAGFLATERILKLVLAILKDSYNFNIKFVFLPNCKDPYDIIHDSKEDIEYYIKNASKISKAIFYCVVRKNSFNDDPESYLRKRNAIKEYTSLIPDVILRKKFFYHVLSLFKTNNSSILENKTSPLFLITNEILFLNICIAFPALLQKLNFYNSFKSFNFSKNKEILKIREILLLNREHTKINKQYNDVIKVSLLKQYGVEDKRGGIKLWQKIIINERIKILQILYKVTLKKSFYDVKLERKLSLITNVIRKLKNFVSGKGKKHTIL